MANQVIFLKVRFRFTLALAKQPALTELRSPGLRGRSNFWNGTLPQTLCFRLLSHENEGPPGAEVRSPKAEGRKKPDARRSGTADQFGFRASAFFRPSGFGLRISTRDRLLQLGIVRVQAARGPKRFEGIGWLGHWWGRGGGQPGTGPRPQATDSVEPEPRRD
jgi:hypothetical protein